MADTPKPAKPLARPENCFFCNSTNFSIEGVFDSKPDGETDFGLQSYHRELHQCQGCGHYYAEHTYDLDQIYRGSYLDAKYQDLEGLKQRAEKILNLPLEKSDNAGRVQRVIKFAESQGINNTDPNTTILDVGSGLCVFLARIKQESNWDCHALDADPRYMTHASTNFEVQTHESLKDAAAAKESFTIISWNKVLEHIQAPVQALAESLAMLENGFCYIELPDGETAAHESLKDRAEFYIDHYHAFSAASLSLLVANAGGELLRLDRITDPSGKATLACFLKRAK